MSHEIIFYCTTALCASSFLILWFKSSLPCLVFGILEKIGYKKHSAEYWDVDGVGYITGERYTSPFKWSIGNWETFAAIRLKMLGELLTCHYCLSVHAVIYSNVLGWLITLLLGYSIGIGAVTCAIVSQVPIVLIIYGIEERLLAHDRDTSKTGRN